MISRNAALPIIAALLVGIVYYFTTPDRPYSYDYTYRIARALLSGQVGIEEAPPPWLNEMVPLNGRFYSVFPLGSVIAMIPLVVLDVVGVLSDLPEPFVAALLAAGITWCSYRIAQAYCDMLPQCLVYSVLLPLGTWTWPNLGYAGSWQIALGLAMLGQLGAIYFTIIQTRVFLAGCCFALAFGNRTEVVLLAPIFWYLLSRRYTENAWRDRAFWRDCCLFMLVPIVLGVATLAYNGARFGSILDFGYARIPGVLSEPWYKHGIFSVHAIPLNIRCMLFETWNSFGRFPYFAPTGFGGSIFISTPFLFLLFRSYSRDVTLTTVSWIAITILSTVLWLHGNPGGWQVSYRYAMVLLPWCLLILLQKQSIDSPLSERILLLVSIAINAYSTYLFLWRDSLA